MGVNGDGVGVLWHIEEGGEAGTIVNHQPLVGDNRATPHGRQWRARAREGQTVYGEWIPYLTSREDVCFKSAARVVGGVARVFSFARGRNVQGCCIALYPQFKGETARKSKMSFYLYETVKNVTTY